jgi:hypothetical protein
MIDNGQMKHCPGCGHTKDVSEFRSDNSRKDRIDHYCMGCRSRQRQERLQSNPDYERAKARKYHAEHRQELADRDKAIQEVVAAMAKLRGCAITGAEDGLCYHHKEKSTKCFKLSKAHDHPWPDILDEMDKCDVLTIEKHGQVHAALDEKRVINPVPEFSDYMWRRYGLIPVGDPDCPYYMKPIVLASPMVIGKAA